MGLKSYRIPTQDWGPRSKPQGQAGSQKMKRLQVYRGKQDTDPLLNGMLPALAFPHWTWVSGVAEPHPSAQHPPFNTMLWTSIPRSPQSLCKPWADQHMESAFTRRAWSSGPSRADLGALPDPETSFTPVLCPEMPRSLCPERMAICAFPFTIRRMQKELLATG